MLLVLAGHLPNEVFESSLVLAGVGLLASGAVGVFTGIRGPSWPIYALIFAELAALFPVSCPLAGARLRVRSGVGHRVHDGKRNRFLPQQPSSQRLCCRSLLP